MFLFTFLPSGAERPSGSRAVGFGRGQVSHRECHHKRSDKPLDAEPENSLMSALRFYIAGIVQFSRSRTAWPIERPSWHGRRFQVIVQAISEPYRKAATSRNQEA